MKASILMAAAALGLALLGCGGKEPPPGGPALVAYAEQAQQEAADAQAAGKVKASRAASDRAQAALKNAEKAATDNASDAEAQETLTAVKQAARLADYSAGLADEENAYVDKIGSLKAKGYRLGRTVALKTVFTSLSLAADVAGARGYDYLPAEAKEVADVALDAAGSPRLADGTPDWTAVSKTMSAYAGQPPAETPVVLAIAMLIMRRYELALIEADAITVPNDAPPYDQALLIAIRTFALRSNGYPKMAARQAQAVPEGSESGKALNDPQVQAVLCLLRAYMAAQDRDYRQADLELVQAMRIYPNSPIVVYLTGEVQVGEGQFEKAQVSLDGLVQGLPPDTDPWLLEHLRDRARYLRDKKGEPEPLIADPQFVARLALHCLWQSAKTSEPIRKIQEKVESAREFGAQFLKVLPGGGGAAEE